MSTAVTMSSASSTNTRPETAAQACPPIAAAENRTSNALNSKGNSISSEISRAPSVPSTPSVPYRPYSAALHSVQTPAKGLDQHHYLHYQQKPVGVKLETQHEPTSDYTSTTGTLANSSASYKTPARTFELKEYTAELRPATPAPTHVTPPEADPSDHHHLGAEDSLADDERQLQHQLQQQNSSESESNSAATSSSARGLVSKRGRYVSPARRISNLLPTKCSSKEKETHPADVMEFKTFRSPPRSGDEQTYTKTMSAAKTPGLSMSVTKSPALASTSDGTFKENRHGVIHSKESQSRQEHLKHDAPKSPLASHHERDVGSLLFSPGQASIFLSPNYPPRFEEKKVSSNAELLSPTRDQHEKDDRDDQYLATPTDFAMDYGKAGTAPPSDSNVLSWLHSPSPFSPGLGAFLSTPRNRDNIPYYGVGLAPRTPRTPTVSTSFFFSDADNLPKNSNSSSEPVFAANTPGSSKRNGIICISPLASAKSRNAKLPAAVISTPLTAGSTASYLRDVFASPKPGSSLPLLMNDNTPARGASLSGIPNRCKGSTLRLSQRSSSSKDPNLEAVAAERELMEDEDLSLLLQFASTNTPRPASSEAGPVFRSPKPNEDGCRSDLQLPMIGDKNDPKQLKQKRSKEDFLPPHLEMRSSSSSSKEVFVGSLTDKNQDADKRKSSLSCAPYTLAQQQSVGHLGTDVHSSYYGMHPSLPPGIPPGQGGSMRVVVGAPSPNGVRSGSPPRLQNSSSQPGPPSHYDYHAMPPPYPGAPPPPPPGGVYGQYPGPPHMSYPPYQSHYPPPVHRPIGAYNTAQQNPVASAKKPSSKPKTPKAAGVKRPAPEDPVQPTATASLDAPESASKPKKARKSTNGSAKKKNRSPQITDKVERQKASQKIQEVNAASGGKNDKAAALAAAILRGVTMRPSGKWQAQLYFAGKSRYIGVFDTREKAALAYEIAREKLKTGAHDTQNGKNTENLVNAARKAAFEGVNERGPTTGSSDGAVAEETPSS